MNSELVRGPWHCAKIPYGKYGPVATFSSNKCIKPALCNNKWIKLFQSINLEQNLLFLKNVIRYRPKLGRWGAAVLLSLSTSRLPQAALFSSPKTLSCFALSMPQYLIQHKTRFASKAVGYQTLEINCHHIGWTLNLKWKWIKSKSKISLYWLFYAEECKEFAGAHLRTIMRTSSTALFEEISQRWRAIGNTVFDLTGLRFDP